MSPPPQKRSPPRRNPPRKGLLHHERSPAMARALSRSPPGTRNRLQTIMSERALRRCGNQHIGSVTVLHRGVLVQADCQDRWPEFRLFSNPPHWSAPAPATMSSAAPGPAQPRLSPTNQPSLQVAAWRMIAAAGKCRILLIDCISCGRHRRARHADQLGRQARRDARGQLGTFRRVPHGEHLTLLVCARATRSPALVRARAPGSPDRAGAASASTAASRSSSPSPVRAETTTHPRSFAVRSPATTTGSAVVGLVDDDELGHVARRRSRRAPRGRRTSAPLGPRRCRPPRAG